MRYAYTYQFTCRPMIAISSDSHDVVHSQGHGAGYGPRPGALWGRDISMICLTTSPKNRINIAKRVWNIQWETFKIQQFRSEYGHQIAQPIC